MKKYNCPACGAEMVFLSSISVYGVCRHCSSTALRRDVDLVALGVMATLPEDMSPLQIGTTALYQGTRYSLIGRIKMGWAGGYWNEWFMINDDGQKAWLAEAQGFYAFSSEIDTITDADVLARIHNHTAKLRKQIQSAATNKTTSSIPALDLESQVAMLPTAGIKLKNTDLGSYLTLGKKKLKIVDIKHATCIGSEGELPFAARTGRTTVTLDLLGAYGEFGCVEVYNNQVRAYVGQYVGWQAARWQNLRVLEGW